MNHADFVKMYEAGKMKIYVDKRASKELYLNDANFGSSIRTKKIARQAIAFAAFTLAAVCIVLSFYMVAGAAIIGLVIAFKLLTPKTTEIVISSMVNDPWFFQRVREIGVVKLAQLD